MEIGGYCIEIKLEGVDTGGDRPVNESVMGQRYLVISKDTDVLPFFHSILFFPRTFFFF